LSAARKAGRDIGSDHGPVVEAWMCAEGPERSRVVLANVGLTSANRVGVVVQSDMTNKRPAPERTGSAFE
jgi:hypothetical protein